MRGPRSEKRASIKEVAARAGVSVATVSRVLSGRGYVSEEARRRISAAILHLGYRPNMSGRVLRNQDSKTVALIISSVQNSFYAAIALEIERRLTLTDHMMLLCNTNEDGKLQDLYLEEIISRNASAVLMLCAVQSPRVEQLLADQVCVFINRRLASMPQRSFVGIDDYRATRELAGMIARNRPRAIGVVCGPQSSMTSAARLRGLMDGLGEHGLKVEEGDCVEAELSIESGYQQAARLFRDGRVFDALFCGNDQIAYGAFRRCRELALRVPDDVRIFGFDDNPLNEWLAPWLNTVRVPHHRFAQETIKTLHALWAGERDREVILPYEIRIRS